jgi:hypothetical protein
VAIFDDNQGLCPNCQNHSGFQEVERFRVWPTVWHPGQTNKNPPKVKVNLVILSCHYCHKTVVLRDQIVEVPPAEIGGEPESFLNRALVYPRRSPRNLDQTVPESIRSLYREASECEAAGAFRGAGVLYRAAVEELVNHQGGTGKDLYHRIESLKAKNDFPSQLVNDFLHEVRKMGNDSIHAGISYSADEVADVAGLIEEAALVLYVQPEQRRQMREARQQRRDAAKDETNYGAAIDESR